MCFIGYLPVQLKESGYGRITEHPGGFFSADKTKDHVAVDNIQFVRMVGHGSPVDVMI